MKIIYLHQYFKKPDMSGGTRSYEMAKRLIKMGHDVHVVSCWNLPTEHKNWFYEEFEGIKIHWLPSNYNNNMKFKDRVKIFLNYAFRSVSVIKNINADLIFATSTPLTVGIPGVLSSKSKKIPLVFEVRDLWPDVPIKLGFLKNPILKKLSLMLESWIYRNSKAIVCLSPGMRSGVIRNGYPINNVAVIPNSCDINLFKVKDDELVSFRERELSEISDKKIILYAGTFGYVNDLISIIPVAKKMREINQEIVFLFIGDGLQKKDLLSLAKKEELLNKNIFIRDRISKSQIPLMFGNSVLSASFALDVEAIRSNSANKFFDTLASGRPVLINYSGWQKDIIDEYNCGICISDMSPDSAAKVISDYVSNQDKLIQDSISSKYLAENIFSRDILSEQLNKVFLFAIDKSEITPFEVTSSFYGK